MAKMLDKKELLIITFLSLLILFIVGHKVLFSSGIPVLAEQIEVYTPNQFLKIFAFTWNEKVSSFNLADLPKFYIYYLVYLFSKIVSFEVIIKLFLLLVYPLSFISMFLFLRFIFKQDMNKYNSKKDHFIFFLILVASSLIYTFNPWITERARNLIMRYQYAILPILVLLYVKILTLKSSKNSFKNFLFLSILFSLIETYRFVIYFTILATMLVFGYLIKKWKERKVLLREVLFTLIKKHVILIFLVILFVIPFYLPAILHSYNVFSAPVKDFRPEMIQREKPLYVFSLYFPTYNGVEFTNPYPKGDWTPTLFLIITTVSCLFLIKKKKNFFVILPFMLSFIFFILLAIMPSFLTHLLVLVPPLARLLRQPYHNAQFLPFIIATFFTFSLLFLYNSFANLKWHNKTKKRMFVTIFLLLLIISFVSSWPLFTGNLNNYWQPSKIPKSIIKTHKILSLVNGTNVFIFPHYLTSKAIWMNSSSPYDSKPPAGLFDLLSQPLPSFYTGNPFFKYYNPLTPFPFRRPLQGYSGNDWGKIYNAIGVRFFLVHNDTQWSLLWGKRLHEKTQNLTNSLDKDESIKAIYHGKYLSLFDLNNNAKIIAIKEPLLTSLGLPVHASLSNAISLYPSRYALIFFGLNNVRHFLTIGNKIIIKNPNNFAPLILKDPIIMGNKNTNYVNPSQFWSPFYTGSYAFLNFLRIKGIKKWDWQGDYGKGVVLTWANETKLVTPLRINKTGKYKFLVRCFTSKMGGEIRISLGTTAREIKTKDQLNNFVWKNLGTFYLTKGENKITLENVFGMNIVNLYALTPEEDYSQAKKETENVFQNKTIIYIFEGESDIYQNDEKVIPNVNASNGQALLIGSDKVWRNITIVKKGRYKFALKGIGTFKVQIGNHSFFLKLKSLNDFFYSPIIFLDPGKYQMEITPLNITNLIENPSFQYISDLRLPVAWSRGNPSFNITIGQGYCDNRSLKVSTLMNKSRRWSGIVGNSVNVESGKKYLIITHMKLKNSRSHIPFEGYYPNTEKWVQLAQIPSGREGYRGWQKFSGILKIPQNVTKIRPRLNAGEVINKSQGEAISWFDGIEMIPLSNTSQLDVIWLYSTDKNETLDDIFTKNQTPATVNSFHKVNPTLWEVKVNATKPFMMSFAESYDPLWEARIYKGETLIQKVKPVPLYGVINGFWINQTGNLNIKLRYKPQDWFDIGLIISSTTFILCIIYLIYNWRKHYKPVKQIKNK